MTYVVYALRRPGEREPRYIGMTRLGQESRLRQHNRELAYRIKNRLTLSPLISWMRDGAVEAVSLSDHADRQGALAGERAAITAALAAGHRLLNQWMVPADRRAA